MANRKSRIRTIRQDDARRDRNRSARSQLHTQLKKLDDALSGGDKEKIGVELKASIRRLDKSVSFGILHANTAARKKSRICARVAKVS